MSSPSHNVLQNKKWVLSSYPQGNFDSKTNAKLIEEELDLATAPDDKIVVAVDAISVDAFIRTMMDKEAFHGSISLDSPFLALGYGRVVAVGKDAAGGFREGDVVQGMLTASTYAIVTGNGLTKKINFPRVPPSASLGLLGLSGLTAYVGMFAAPPQPPTKGETVVVSAAAGAVGSIAAQMAKLTGARVVGIAGGPKKNAFLMDELKLDGAVDYKSKEKSIGEQLDECCPDGIDFFFDNVGGETLDAVLARINKKARVVICGAVSQYDSGDINKKGGVKGPSNYIKIAERSATMSGFVVMEFSSSFKYAIPYMLWHYYRGSLFCPEHIERGVESFPTALEKMFKGEHRGRLIVDISGGIPDSA